MKDAEIRIELEDQTQVFHAGQDLRGNVHVIVRKTIKPRKIRVELTGKMHASFSETINQGQPHSSGEHSISEANQRVYSETDKFLQEQLKVWEPNQHGASDSITPGEYRFPFCFKLQQDRKYPPIFTGPHGYIRYKLEANIDLAWQIDPTTKIRPVIVGMYNVGDPKYQSPVEGYDAKAICCYCCTSPPITCKLTVPMGGAILGEMVALSIAVSNPSSKRVLAVKCILRQKVDYHVQGAHRSSTKDFELFHSPDTIAPGTNALTLSKQATIPTDIAPSFTSPIITISYYIIVILVMPTFVLNISTSVPFFIGTCRAVQNSASITPQSSSPQQPGYAPQQPGYHPQQPGYPPQQPGYHPQPPGYHPQPPGYHPQQPGYHPQQPGYHPQQPGYHPQQPGYHPQQPGYHPQQPGYPPQQPGYPQ